MGDDDLEFLRASLAVTGLSTATCQGSPFQAGLRDVMRLWHGGLSEGEGGERERQIEWRAVFPALASLTITGTLFMRP